MDRDLSIDLSAFSGEAALISSAVRRDHAATFLEEAALACARERELVSALDGNWVRSRRSFPTRSPRKPPTRPARFTRRCAAGDSRLRPAL